MSALVKRPQGQPGRPSKSLTLEQAVKLLTNTKTRIGTYIAVSVTMGIRTEEVRALRWDHVDLGDPEAGVPGSIAVWRWVPIGDDTKTPRSRRTLRMPEFTAQVLLEWKAAQETGHGGLVFGTRNGTVMSAGNVRRDFKKAVKAAKITGSWTPQELRHSFVSMMSEQGVTLEQIAPLTGHSSTRTIEAVYRKELRPVLATGAEAMDRALRPKADEVTPPPGTP